jgi:hypothetical protein
MLLQQNPIQAEALMVVFESNENGKKVFVLKMEEKKLPKKRKNKQKKETFPSLLFRFKKGKEKQKSCFNSIFKK